jgi:hypothetical protein
VIVDDPTGLGEPSRAGALGAPEAHAPIAWNQLEPKASSVKIPSCSLASPGRAAHHVGRRLGWAWAGTPGRLSFECAMSVLAPTPPERMVDPAGRPYFLWDDDMSMEAFRASLRDPDPEVRAYFIGKLMRQAKPDDVFSFVTVREIETQWDLIERYLGKTRELWRWLLDRWAAPSPVGR